MIEVYLLEHSRIDGEEENYKTLGIFSSIEKAEAAIQLLKGKPGFKDYPDGFNIDRYEVDKIFWVDGFG